MTKIAIAYIGFLLLAVQFSSRVQAQNATTQSTAMTAPIKAGDVSSNMSKMPNVTTKNITIPKGASAFLQSSPVTLLIHVAVVGSLVQGRF